MICAKMSLGFVVVLAIAGAIPRADAASRRLVQAPAAVRVPDTITPTDLSASRRRASRVRHATRVHIYRRGDYSFFEPYAPPVPPFFPFGYHQGYF